MCKLIPLQLIVDFPFSHDFSQFTDTDLYKKSLNVLKQPYNILIDLLICRFPHNIHVTL